MTWLALTTVMVEEKRNKQVVLVCQQRARRSIVHLSHLLRQKAAMRVKFDRFLCYTLSTKLIVALVRKGVSMTAQPYLAALRAPSA